MGSDFAILNVLTFAVRKPLKAFILYLATRLAEGACHSEKHDLSLKLLPRFSRENTIEKSLSGYFGKRHRPPS